LIGIFGDAARYGVKLEGCPMTNGCMEFKMISVKYNINKRGIL
jgi:hypothetical protein